MRQIDTYETHETVLEDSGDFKVLRSQHDLGKDACRRNAYAPVYEWGIPKR